MDEIFLLDYLQWADEAVFRLLRSVDGQLLTEEISDHSKTLHDLVQHLAEQYHIWLYDIKDIDYSDTIEQYSHASTHELMATIEQLHNDWRKYVTSTEREIFTIKESENMPIEVNMEEVLVNLVNHSGYHRGQIMMLLRFFEFDVPITDLYWFKISQKEHLKKSPV